MPKSPLISRKTELSANIVQFCRYLREKGFGVGPVEEADALKALSVVSFTDPETFRLTLRAILTRSLPHQRLFDDLYVDYWKELERAVDSKVKDVEEEQEKKQQSNSQKQNEPSFESLKNWLYGNQSEEIEEVALYSTAEVLTVKDFSTFSEEEMKVVLHIIRIMAKTLATRYNRRYQSSKRQGGIFDLKQTLRKNMRRGGEIVELAFRKRKVRKLRMVMLCDVSKSMDLYSRFLIQFVYAFQQVFRRIETFVFSTQLEHISDYLRTSDYSEALQKLSDHVHNWSGGTRIGASFQSFLTEYGSRYLDHNTIVLIMSDGWDTGEIEILEDAMQKLHRKAAKVVWLNPLAGSAVFEPSAKGMEIAMPYIDVFAPAHNVESLRKVLGNL